VADDAGQARAAQKLLAEAELVAIPVTVWCELVWVLGRSYNQPRQQIAEAIRRLLAAATVTTDKPAAEAGLAAMEQGGDFADGVAAYLGRSLGGQEFVSFDRKAVRVLNGLGISASIPNA
jgi:predicted nucleic-acid-binding protein